MAGETKDSGTADDMGAMLLDRATVVPVPVETLKRWAEAMGDAREVLMSLNDHGNADEEMGLLYAALSELRALIEEPRS